MAVPVPKEKRSVAGAAIVALLLIALALGSGHHLATSGGGSGGAASHSQSAGLPGDPCHHQPDGKTVRVIDTKRTQRGRIVLDCGQWRDIVGRIARRTGAGKPTVRQILDCIETTIKRGVLTPRGLGGDRFLWRWGPTGADYAIVAANAGGRVVLAEPGLGHEAWVNCAKAAA